MASGEWAMAKKIDRASEMRTQPTGGDPSELEKWPFKNQPPLNIAIVGAGMAGLTAGWLLARSGHNVTIYEASSVVGGRVKTLRSGFTSGLYAEAGAMRIPRHHGLTNWLIDDLFGLACGAFRN